MLSYQDISYSCVLEGMTSISAVIHGRESGINNRCIHAILVDRDKKRSKYREIGYLKAMAPLHAFDLRFVSSEDIDAMTQGTTHGGIVALCSDRTYPDCSSIPADGFWVLPDGIEDPYNLGYTLRSLYAAGADGILLPPQNRLCAAGIVAKSSAGTSELLDIRVCDTETATDAFAAAGYRIVCAGIRDSVSIYEADLHKPLLLIVGGEKRGISRAILDKADQVVRIDYGRSFNGSLSAASATTVIAFEVLHQNQN